MGPMCSEAAAKTATIDGRNVTTGVAVAVAYDVSYCVGQSTYCECSNITFVGTCPYATIVILIQSWGLVNLQGPSAHPSRHYEQQDYEQ